MDPRQSISNLTVKRFKGLHTYRGTGRKSKLNARVIFFGHNLSHKYNSVASQIRPLWGDHSVVPIIQNLRLTDVKYNYNIALTLPQS